MVPTPMVYILIPYIFAISAADSGSIEPELFTPSVIRMITLLIASLSFSLLIEVASPSPMAVPSSIIPLLISLKRFLIILWSLVSGDCVKDSPLKMTSPIRSSGRPPINSEATSLAASSLSGRRSWASILLETSMAIIMSIPSMVTSREREVDWGLASATISSAMASSLKANKEWIRYCFQLRFVAEKPDVDENCRPGSLCSSLYQYHPPSNGRTMSRYKKPGFANMISAYIIPCPPNLW